MLPFMVRQAHHKWFDKPALSEVEGLTTNDNPEARSP
jgi:hypothetical protein